MNREQLIDYLEFVLRPSGRAVTFTDFNLLPDILSALRGLGWVRTADRLPTEADAGVDEEIMTIYDDGETRVMGTDYWAYVAMVPEVFPYWTPVPKLPEVEE